MFDPPKEVITKRVRERKNHVMNILGIALIVDQKGVGPMLVTRYPTQPTQPSSPVDDQEYSNDDLFFKLTAFQMAKLFRTKKSLANKPMVRFLFLALIATCSIYFMTALFSL